MRMGALASGVTAALLGVMAAAPGYAQPSAPFFAGKTIQLNIGYSAGAGYDVHARMLAHHMAKHIPGHPTIVPKNMPGAGSLSLANWLYNVAPKDGTTFGTIGRGTGFDPLLGSAIAKFDATKFNWIGSTNNEVSVCVAWHLTGITKIEDVVQREMTVGGNAPSADPDQFARILNGVIDAKFKIISGYPGGNDINLARERREVDGRCGWSWSSLKATRQRWVDEKKINVLVQLSLAKHRDLPDVPLVMDLVKDPDRKKILALIFTRQAMGWPFLAPPGVPQERIEILRKAFMDTMKDEEFLADAAKAQLEITPVSGVVVQKLVVDAYKTDPAVVRKAVELLATEKK
ncbi:MAG: hypothetical protein IT536_01535 [Hyphomicrobiales bacterium]|nr:hypothetical protein [Hyphomicrobiales bacterium]